MTTSATEVVLTVVVDRSRWLRGEGEDRSFLLRASDRKMCCLGFACLAAGHTEDEIRNVATPGSIRQLRDIKCLLPNNREMAIGLAMSVNDEIGISEQYRETVIIAHLAQAGIAISFVDGPVQEGDPGSSLLAGSAW